MSTQIPIVPGDGRPAWFQDSEDYGRLVVLPEACEGIDPKLWALFAEPDPQLDQDFRQIVPAHRQK